VVPVFGFVFWIHAEGKMAMPVGSFLIVIAFFRDYRSILASTTFVDSKFHLE
jgi:hypothetical protein